MVLWHWCDVLYRDTITELIGKTEIAATPLEGMTGGQQRELKDNHSVISLCQLDTAHILFIPKKNKVFAKALVG